MSEEAGSVENGGALKYVLLGVALVYVVASLVFFYVLNDRLTQFEKKQAEFNADAEKRIAAAKASTEALAGKLGMTEKELAARTAQLQREQRASESRLAEQAKQQIGAAAGELKTEVGAVKTDVAATRTELEATKVKLERAIGDLGQQSGLIARTREELEWLKQRGDRNYFEFTLQKGSRPTPLSTISLQLKKADVKKNKFNLNVIADDKVIEKKDKTLFEPLQFYTGRDRQLYEVVVTAVEKNRVVGYLATPKNVPPPH